MGRLEAVDLGDGAGDNDGHGVGHIVLVQRGGDAAVNDSAAEALHIGGIRPTVHDRFFCFLLSCHRDIPLFDCLW